MVEKIDFLFANGDDEKSKRFINALLSSRGTKNIDNTIFGQLLQAGNYKNYENNYDSSNTTIIQNKDDVHQDVMNFIMNTGIHHSQISNNNNRNIQKKFLNQLVKNIESSNYDFINNIL